MNRVPQSRDKPLHADVYLHEVQGGEQAESFNRQLQMAQAQIGEMEQQLRVLQAITDTALSHLSLEDFLREVVHRLSEILSVDTVAILLLSEDGKHLIVRVASGLEEEVKQEVHIPVGQGFAGQIVTLRGPLIVPDLAQIEVASQILRETVCSIMGVPLIVDDKVIGVLHTGTKRPSLFTEHDVELLQRVADRIARAIDYTTLYQAEKQARAQAIAHAHQLEVANAQLEQASKMQRSFISIVGHEMRTPLTSIQGFSELLRDEKWSVTEVKEFASDIALDAQRLNRIISEMLDLERMKSGFMRLNVTMVRLNVLLRETVMHAQISTQKHTFRLILDEQVSQVQADEDKLTQIMTNLLSNAAKYSSHGGEILIASQREEERVHIRVQDHGMGIPAQELKNLFTPFYRVESTSMHSIQGTGLGLSIVKEIIEMHQGNVWVESTLVHSHQRQ
jgi:signal transduction histidine kinase